MTIRSKLILSSVGLVTLILFVGGASIWSLSQWKDAAELVELDRARTLLVDRIRSEMRRQVDYANIHLSGGPAELESFLETDQSLAGDLFELKQLITKPEEEDHVQGFEETLFELSYTARNIIESIDSNSIGSEVTRRRSHLQELADEVSDDIAVLDQYYRRQVDESVVRAERAGATAGWIIGLALLVAIFQVLTTVFVSQRWLVRPIIQVGQATTEISRGNWDVRLQMPRSDEWGELAKSVNHMATSLARLQSQVQTKERLAAVGEVAAYTAHNIRNPLAGIRAAAQVAIEELPEGETTTRETLVDIIETVDRMERWIKALMNFAAPVKLDVRSGSLAEIIREVTSLLKAKADQESVRLITDVPENLPRLSIDHDLFSQALANIVVNAIESGTDRVKITASGDVDKAGVTRVNLEIRDFGCGLDAEIEPKLFQAFTTNKSGGTGLGLAQAKKIVELHQGELSIESVQGEGVTVTISLIAGATA